MRWRTEIQIALLVVGVFVWGLGLRTENDSLQYAGIACFAVATVLRLVKRRPD